MTDGPISRDELLSGRIPQHRRAQRIVGSIESRVLYMREETNRALRAYFYGDFSEYQRGLDRDYFAVVRQRAQSEKPLLDEDLERFVPQWRMLVPTAPELRAAVLHVLGQRLRLRPSTTPLALAVLGCEEPVVREIYIGEFGEAPEQTFEQTIPTRRALSDEEEDPILRVVGDRAQWLTVPGGTRLFAAGDPGDALYLVVSGRFRVMQGGDDTDAFIAEIGRGEVVGEMGALTGEPRSADVLAARDSEVIQIPQALLMEVAASAPEMLLRINRDLVTRLRETTAGVTAPPSISTYAIIGTDPGAPVQHVARVLAQAMRGIGTTAHITRTEVERRSSPDAGDQLLPVFSDPQLIAWLAEQESASSYVLYEADPQLTPWTRRCIRQADRILLVANAGADPSPGQIDEEIAAAGSQHDVELLLVHPDSTEHPTGTANWIKNRDLHAHHHLRFNDDAQLRHIARMITGTALGIAFSGGGARGAAHLGVVQALHERGIEIDVIGGTSMGSLMGGRLATGLDPREVAQRLTDVLAELPVLDWTLPIVALAAGENANTIVFGEFRSLRIEDLWRPFFCISTNLTSAEAVIHRSGSLWTAIRASLSIPGVFPPVLSRDGDLLVDGGIMNNFPIDLVRQSQGVGTVIGSSVGADRELEDAFRYGSTASGWKIALSRLPGVGPRINAPSILSTLMRSNEARGVALARTAEFTAQADLIVQPSVAEFPILDFSHSPELVDIGYRAANDAFDDWDGIDALVRLNSPANPRSGAPDVAL